MSGARWLIASGLVAFGLAAGCSRRSDGGEGATAATAGASSTLLPTPRTASAAPGVVSASPGAVLPVPTPEDAEEDAAHRITDQNLESELDRLEREIQAE